MRDRLHSVSCLLSAAVTQFGQKPQNFQIEPDQSHQQSEAAIPLHVFGSACGGAALDEIEVKDQIERGDDHHKNAETDSDQSRAIDGRKMNSKESENEGEQIEECDATCRCNHAHAELVRHVDYS